MVHLRDTLKSEAAKAAAREGRSLDQFVNEAVEEKLRHTRHVTTIQDRGAPLEDDGVEAAR
ncbi:hypothetical protein [Azospirillum rugosum]|uniref:HicB family protein n=1 Tax=Azospirillum rugosum TaxID=416170 RepID=A0ABS4SPS8_9PROT|nr:hypothetical protein [Azospirillum rugosum]MBP2293962.1 hypothetical protein [Azospirillum rugosum]MDQ0526851.1 hypothetical protein [Azospirillum rugosum]